MPPGPIGASPAVEETKAVEAGLVEVVEAVAVVVEGEADGMVVLEDVRDEWERHLMTFPDHW